MRLDDDGQDVELEATPAMVRRSLEQNRDLRTALRLKPDFNDAKQALQRLGVEP